MTLTVPTAAPDAPAAGPTTRSVPPRLRALLAVLAAALAFAPSLYGLVADLRYGAPTGDLVAVPVVAAVMLDSVVRRRRSVWTGRLGLGDLLAAAVLSLAALLLVLLPTARTTNDQWLTRLDLLGHPLALAAFAVLLLGLRVLAVGLVPLAFGLLVWPWPVTWLNVHAVAPLTTATYQACGHLAEWLGVARMVDVSAENTLRIGEGGDAFEVSVAPACSGITGLAAYLVVAGAVLALSQGRLVARVGWVACGLLAVWFGNVLRIVGLAAAGRAWGADVALDLLHPVAGLLIDAVVVAVLVASMQRFGLRWAAPPAEPATPVSATGLPVVLHPPSLRALGLRGGLVAVVAGGLLAADLTTGGTTATAFSDAPRRTVALADVSAVGTGAVFVGREEWSTVYFGADSQWDRYRVEAPTGDTVWLDALVVSDQQALRAHDVLGCYNFHGAEILEEETVRLDGRVTATRLVVRQADGERWSTLWWEWPVLTASGLRHERVTLFTGGLPPQATPGGAPASAGARPGDLAGDDADPRTTQALVTTAERVVERALARTEPGR